VEKVYGSGVKGDDDFAFTKRLVTDLNAQMPTPVPFAVSKGYEETLRCTYTSVSILEIFHLHV
jgi:hypothetical protein